MKMAWTKRSREEGSVKGGEKEEEEVKRKKPELK
jgi:hypothetical protein